MLRCALHLLDQFTKPLPEPVIREFLKCPAPGCLTHPLREIGVLEKSNDSSTNFIRRLRVYQ